MNPAIPFFSSLIAAFTLQFIQPTPLESTATLQMMAVNQADSLALVEMYNALDGSNWINQENWLTESPVSEWHGITTGEIDGQERVTAINIRNNRLAGTIPQELTQLDALTRLDLANDNNVAQADWNLVTGINSLDNMSNLLTIQMGNNQLTSLPSLDQLSNLRELLVANNQLQALPALENVNTLQYLNCSGNEAISIIPDLNNHPDFYRLGCERTAISQLPNFSHPDSLTIIWALNTQLTGAINLEGMSQIGDLRITSAQPISFSSFNSLGNLGYFHIQGNPISALPAMDSLKNVFWFSVQNSGLTSFPDMSSMVMLREFNASRNDIPVFPGVESLGALEEVTLANNPLENTPDFSSVILTYLDLDATTISNAPDLSQFPGLEVLNLSRNPITEVPGLGSLSQLQTLFLVETEISELPALGLLTELRNLQLNSPISALPDLSELTKLEDVRITAGGAQLTSLPELTSPELELLSVVGHNLSQIHDLSVHPKLRILDIPDNQNLEEIPGLGALNQLTRLDIASNKIRHLDGAENLVNLNEADVQRNKLNFTELGTLQSLSLSGFSFNPQDSLERPGVDTAYIGLPYNLSSQAGGVGTNVQWIMLPEGDNPFATTATLNFPSISNDDQGKYVYRAKNPDFPGLELVSHAKELQVQVARNRQTDSLALVVFYNATGGPNWTDNTNWLSDQPLDTWLGVTLNEGRVSRLALPPQSNLVDTIPAEISLLSELRVLSLTFNSITHVEDLSGLTKLQTINLYNNQISSLPDLNSLTDLIELRIMNNELAALPALDSLQKLRDLQFYNNKLLQFPSLSNHPDLQILYAGINKDIGLVPDLSGLTGLLALRLDSMGLSQIPTLPNQENITSLRLDNNPIRQLPNLDGFPSLRFLDCVNCRLASISSLDNLDSLRTLNLRQNQLTAIPSLNQLSKLEILRLESNQLTDLPSLDQLVNLQQIWVEGNQLSNLPNLDNATNLTTLSAGNNQLATLPFLGNNKQLINLWVAIQTSPGGLQEVPGLEELDSLKSLIAYANAFDSIPELGALENLEEVFIDRNQITVLPDLSNLSKLKTFVAFSNELTELPELNPNSIEGIGVSNNQLSKLPTLEEFENLKILQVDRNQIDSIQGLETLENLEEIEAYENELQFISDLHPDAPIYEFLVQDNQLGSLPAMRKDLLRNVNLSSNRLGFGELEAFLGLPADSAFTFAPQDSLESPSEETASLFEAFNLESTVGGENTLVQWFKLPDTDTPIADSSILHFRSTTFADSGVYLYTATNPAFPDLELVSHPTTINISVSEEAGDLFALQEIYRATGGPNWTNNTNWLTDAPLEEWYGVTMNEGRVFGLDLANNNLIDSVPDAINFLNGLLTLELENNQIRYVSSLNGVSTLRYLALTNNQLQAFPTFVGELPNLLTLYVNNNEDIGFIPDLNGLVNLVHLQVQQTGIRQIPQLPNPERLETLRIGLNNMGSLPNLDAFTGLNALYCENCSLTSLPSLDALVELKTLDVTSNQLNSLPSLDKLTELSILHLRFNQLTALPSLENNSKLTQLWANNNNLISLPELTSLTELEQLYAGNNQLTSLPFLGEQKKMLTLSIGGQKGDSKIRKIPGLAELESLRSLLCSNNQIDSLPGLENLGNLVDATINDNEITYLPGLSNLTQLQKFSAFRNNLVQVPDLSPDALLSFDIRFNQVSTLPDFSPFVQLQKILIEQNPIDSIKGLHNLENLNTLRADRCSLNYISDIHPDATLNELRVSHNKLFELPPIRTDSLQTAFLANNNLSFGQMLPFQQLASSDTSVNFTFAPQDSIDAEQFIAAYQDSSLFLRDRAGGGEATRLAWFKDGVFLDSLVGAGGLVIDRVTADTEGDYFYTATHPDFPELTLTSRVKHVKVYEESILQLLGTVEDTLPDLPLKLVANIPEDLSEEQRDSVRIIFESLGAKQVNSCICNTLEVWAFPDTIREYVSNVPREYINPETTIEQPRKNLGAKESDIKNIILDWNYKLNLKDIPKDSSQWIIESEDFQDFQAPVAIALPDFGTDISHNKLRSSLWVNPNPNSGDKDCQENDIHGWDFVNDTTLSAIDSTGHATHIAGLILSVVEEAPLDLMSLRIGTLNRSTVFELACAINYAIMEEAKIINMSVGYRGPESAMLRKAMEATVASDILVVASSGNESLNNDSTRHWPSNYFGVFDNVISVAAYDNYLEDTTTGNVPLAPFSNFGEEKTAIAAPGVDIFSLLPNQGFGPKSGTSVSAGFVTGILASLRARFPEQNAQEILDYFYENFTLDNVDSLKGKVKDARRLDVRLRDCREFPSLEDDEFMLAGEAVYVINALGNDCTGLGVEPEILVYPEHGDLYFDNGEFLYVPEPGYEGADSFQYQICNRLGNNCAEATVNLVVENPETSSPFILIDAATDQDLQVIAPNESIELGTYGIDLPNINIRFDSNLEGIDSVLFILDSLHYWRERLAPFALGGDTLGDYNPTSFLEEGWHDLIAIPMIKGIPQQISSIRFELIRPELAPDNDIQFFTVPVETSPSNIIPPIFVYPNPSNGLINMFLPADLGNEVQITLLDLQGKKLEKYKFKSGIQVIDLRRWPRGVYFLQIQSEREPVLKRIIIN